jgi:hypothetical protein
MPPRDFILQPQAAQPNANQGAEKFCHPAKTEEKKLPAVWILLLSQSRMTRIPAEVRRCWEQSQPAVPLDFACLNDTLKVLVSRAYPIDHRPPL